VVTLETNTLNTTLPQQPPIQSFTTATGAATTAATAASITAMKTKVNAEAIFSGYAKGFASMKVLKLTPD
jgi:hypothetical protein